MNKELKDITITVYATQDTVESDSFDKDYDAGAEYPVVAVANVNNNGNTNYNNASNSNGVRPDSSINQRRRRCYPFCKDK